MVPFAVVGSLWEALVVSFRGWEAVLPMLENCVFLVMQLCDLELTINISLGCEVSLVRAFGGPRFG